MKLNLATILVPSSPKSLPGSNATISGCRQDELVFVGDGHTHIAARLAADDEGTTPFATGPIGGEIDAAMIATQRGCYGQDSIVGVGSWSQETSRSLFENSFQCDNTANSVQSGHKELVAHRF